MDVDDEVDDPEVVESNASNQDDPINDETDDARPGTRAIRHSCDVYLAEGVYTDCNNILKKFLSLQTSTFEDFVTLWKERNFADIYSGRDSYAELLEFSEEVLAIAKSFMLPPHSQIKRIGALYLMYGLYTQQPIPLRFRVTTQEWSVILKFVDNLKAHGFIDANYIFHKMTLDGAFLTVAMNREYGLERNYRKYLMPWPARDQELDPCVTFSLETLMGRVYRGSLKAAADKCRIKYNSIKSILEGKKGFQFQGLQGTEMDLDHVMLANMESVVEVPPDFLGGSTKFSNIGLGRKNLKDKAFQHHAQLKGSVLVDASTPQNTSNSDYELPSESDDSNDSDFEYMMRPPSMRNSRNIKSKKREKEKKQKGKEKIQVPSAGLQKRGCVIRKASYQELTGVNLLKPGRSSKKQKAVKETDETSQQAESCPLIDISDEEATAVNPGKLKSTPSTSKKGRNSGKARKSVSVTSPKEVKPAEVTSVAKEARPKSKPKRTRRRSSNASSADMSPNSCSVLESLGREPLNSTSQRAKSSTGKDETLTNDEIPTPNVKTKKSKPPKKAK